MYASNTGVQTLPDGDRPPMEAICAETSMNTARASRLLFDSGGDLDDVWASPFFEEIRRWQRSYGFGAGPSRDSNRLRPCPVRDHYRTFAGRVERHRPEPEDEAAAAALRDGDYRKRMVSYG